MEWKYPDFDRCLVNLSCSVEKFFGLTPAHATLPEADRLLQQNRPRNVLLLVLDGRGTAICRDNLDADGFFGSHLVCGISSVFPPTTVAATTSIQSARYPNEHGWLGWDVYFPEVGENVTVFRNTRSGTDEPAAAYPVAETLRPYESVQKRVAAAGFGGYSVQPFGEFDTLEKMAGEITRLCALPGRKYLYCYWAEPDHSLHEVGRKGEKIPALVRELESWVRALSAQLTDSLLFVTADHGHIDHRGTCLADHPAIDEALAREPSIEPRAVNLFVKDGYKADFPARFAREFGEHFLLLPRAQVLAQGLFGPGANHPMLEASIGDFLAVAKDEMTLFNTREQCEHMVGVHAGLCAEEVDVPLIAIPCP